MMFYKNLVLEFDEMPKERNALFICVHFGNVINSFKSQAKEWLDKHGNVMRIIGEKELLEIKKEIDEYHKKLDSEPSHIDELKRMLNEITDILS